MLIIAWACVLLSSKEVEVIFFLKTDVNTYICMYVHTYARSETIILRNFN